MSETKDYTNNKEVNNAIDTIFAPALVSFAVWVIRSAKEDRVKKLMFLSRDAYPVYIVVDSLCKRLQVPIKCRYIFCSRFSLRQPMYSENLDEAVEYITRDGIDVNLEKIIRRAGVKKDDIERKLHADLNDDLFSKERLNKSELALIKQYLRTDGFFLELVKEESQKSWPDVEAYFRQEGMLENVIAIVDSGWTGTTQKSIDQIRKRAGCDSNVIGYYFGLYDIPEDVDRKLYKSFYFAPNKRLLKKIFFNNCFFEAMFSCKDSGTTRGYKKRKDGMYEPVFEDHRKIEEERYYTERMIKKAITIAEKIESDEYDYNSFLRKSIPKSNPLSRLMTKPTSGEANAFGKVSFSDDLLDDSVKQLAPKMTEQELRTNHLLHRIMTATGTTNSTLKESAWYEGSVVRISDLVEHHIRQHVIYKSLRLALQSIRYFIKGL